MDPENYTNVPDQNFGSLLIDSYEVKYDSDHNGLICWLVSD